MLPNIREVNKHKKTKQVTKTKLQLPNSGRFTDQSGFTPNFDSINSKIHDYKYTLNHPQKSKAVYTIQNSTSFFLKALESQQAILEEKKSKNSTPSPFKAKEKASTIDSKREKQSNQSEMRKTMQKSVLDSLTFEMLNPVVLISKEQQRDFKIKQELKR